MSKGSTRRPTQLTQAELAERWAEAFGVGERQQSGGVADAALVWWDAWRRGVGSKDAAEVARVCEVDVLDVDDQC